MRPKKGGLFMGSAFKAGAQTESLLIRRGDPMIDPMLRLAGKLLVNGLRFQYLKRTGRAGRPQAISLEITHRCIARCVMCNIWKIPSDVEDLSVDQWLHLLGSEFLSDIRELDITGGEPFLKEDLPALFSGISNLKQRNLKALTSIAVTTNGLLTDRVLHSCREILKILKEAHLDLVVVCAMDAIGDLHDRIRNYRNAWAKVDKTIQGLKSLREEYPNLIIGLKTTILPVNVNELAKIVLYADANGLFTIISPCIITDGRYLNPDRAADLQFSRADIAKMTVFYRSELFRWGYHAETLARYYDTGVMKKPCSSGFNYLFIRSTGDVFLCPLIDLSVGNIRTTPVEDMFNSPKASLFRQRIGKHLSCLRCTEPGLERYALPYEGLSYLSLLFRMGRRKFLEFHKHMGLDKYFDT
ncbi:radical SAM/SPASM domain-containing protein [Thermodesulfobacteriota bacterium]